MDDYSIHSLGESKNEWCARLINVLTPELIQGLKSIFEEAWKLCQTNDEEDKYLLIFQTFLSRVPKWNSTIIQTEVARIIEKSGCAYLEELLTCVHVIHLKILTCVRVGQRQKKVDIDVPSLNDFIHKTYVNIARKVYTNSYLFERNIPPLQIQKHNRELEVIIKECILNTVLHCGGISMKSIHRPHEFLHLLKDYLHPYHPSISGQSLNDQDRSI